MLSTISDSYSKQGDIHLKLSMQPYHLIPRSPLMICYQMTDQHVGKRKDSIWQTFETAAMLKLASFRKENYNQPNRICTSSSKMKECCAVCTGRYLVFPSITLQLNGIRMLSF